MSNLRRISWVFLLINQARWFLEKLEIDFNWLSIPHLLVRDLNLLNLQVYLTLCCALVASAAGAYLHILWNIGGLLTTIACFGCIAWLLSISPYEEVLFGLFYGFFFPSGAVHIHFSGIDLVSLLGVCVSFFSFFSWAAKEGCSLDGNCTPRRGFYRSSDWSGHSDWSKVHVTCTIFVCMFI